LGRVGTRRRQQRRDVSRVPAGDHRRAGEPRDHARAGEVRRRGDTPRTGGGRALADAYSPEFDQAAIKLPRARWAASAAAIKEKFLTMFARRTRTLLNDREYHEALLDVQSVPLSTPAEPAPGAADRLTKGLERMAAAEARLFQNE